MDLTPNKVCLELQPFSPVLIVVLGVTLQKCLLLFPSALLKVFSGEGDFHSLLLQNTLGLTRGFIKSVPAIVPASALPLWQTSYAVGKAGSRCGEVFPTSFLVCFILLFYSFLWGGVVAFWSICWAPTFTRSGSFWWPCIPLCPTWIWLKANLLTHDFKQICSILSLSIVLNTFISLWEDFSQPSLGGLCLSLKL